RPAACGGSGSCRCPPAQRLARGPRAEVREVIARLSGIVLEKREDAAVLDVQGVGYLIHLSLQSMAHMPPEGARAQLRCHTHVREDALQLFGFVSSEEEELFRLLIAVSGVGPKLAMNILSGMPATELAAAILHGELARLTKIPGVGKKTAERLMVELKDRIATSGLAAGARSSQASLAGAADAALLSALMNLGYRPAAAERTAEAVRRNRGAPVGWCAYARRVDLPKLQRSPSLACDDAADVWSIPCFFVKAGFRGKGIARALLRHALRSIRLAGGRTAEAYPVQPPATNASA